jgi:hypothetical protein
VHVDVLPWEGSKIPMHPCRRIDLGRAPRPNILSYATLHND